MIADPKQRADQKCVRCEQPKKQTRKAATGKAPAAKGFTRVNRNLWLEHLEGDPFCSRECCEVWHGLAADIDRHCEFGGCGKPFTVRRNRPSQRFCSQVCAKRQANVRRREARVVAA